MAVAEGHSVSGGVATHDRAAVSVCTAPEGRWEKGWTGTYVRSYANSRVRYERFLRVTPGSGEVLLFRLCHAALLHTHSLRRAVQDVLLFA